MPAEQPASAPAQSSAEMLRQLLETSEAGRKAASSLSEAASVGVRFTDVPGDFRFHAVHGKPRFEPGKADEPDQKILVKVHSGLLKLTMRGWLRVVVIKAGQRERALDRIH